MAIAFRRNTRIIREQELNRLRAEIASGRVENKKSLGQLKRKLRELEEKYST
jgi:hypothetical protein